MDVSAAWERHLEKPPQHRGDAVYPGPRPGCGYDLRSQLGSFLSRLVPGPGGLREPSHWGAFSPSHVEPIWPGWSFRVASRREGCSDSSGWQAGHSCVFPPTAPSVPSAVRWPVAAGLHPLPEFGSELRFSSAALKTLGFSVSPGPVGCRLEFCLCQ